MSSPCSAKDQGTAKLFEKLVEKPRNTGKKPRTPYKIFKTTKNATSVTAVFMCTQAIGSKLRATRKGWDLWPRRYAASYCSYIIETYFLGDFLWSASHALSRNFLQEEFLKPKPSEIYYPQRRTQRRSRFFPRSLKLRWHGMGVADQRNAPVNFRENHASTLSSCLFCCDMRWNRA